MSKYYVRRVDQLDAASLNDELCALLIAQFRSSLTYLPKLFLARFGPELQVMFQLIFKDFPLQSINSSFGQRLFNLEYVDCSTNGLRPYQKLRALTILTTLVPWFWERIVRRSIRLNSQLSTSAINLEQYFQIIYKSLTLLNFCVFLQKSTFPSLAERFLNIRPVHLSAQEIRPLECEGITRELLWHGIAEFLGFALPLINVHRIKNVIRQKFASWKRTKIETDVQKHSCHMCGRIPNFPHTIGCLHVYCYYCIASNLQADPNYFCSSCEARNANTVELKPLNLNIL